MRCSPVTEKVKLLQETLTWLTGTVFGIKPALPKFDCVSGDTACWGIIKMSIFLCEGCGNV